MMMIAFLIIYSYSVVVKQVTVLNEATNEEVEERNKEVRDDYNYHLAECTQEYPEKECKSALSYILDKIYTNNELLNKTLRDLPKNTNLLHVIAINFRGTIDFTLLPSKMLVYLESTYHSAKSVKDEKFKNIENLSQRFIEKMKEIKYDGSQKSFFELSKSLVSKDKNPKYEYEYLEKISLVGNIGSKVPFITFDTVVLEIFDSNLDCENAYFNSVILKDNSKNITVKNLILEETVHRSLDLEKVNVTQYLIRLKSFDKYYLTYGKYNFKVYKYESITQEKMDQNLDIPYSISKYIGFFTISEEIEISTNARSSEEVFPDFNLTISSRIANKPDLSSDKLILTTKGWNLYDGKKPKIFLAIDSNVNLDTTKVSDIEISKSAIPEYQYPNNDEGNKDNKKKTAMIIGIVVAVVVVIAIIIIVVVVIVIRKKKANQSISEGEGAAEK